jgi:hypothetical protein
MIPAAILFQLATIHPTSNSKQTNPAIILTNPPF